MISEYPCTSVYVPSITFQVDELEFVYQKDASKFQLYHDEQNHFRNQISQRLTFQDRNIGLRVCSSIKY